MGTCNSWTNDWLTPIYRGHSVCSMRDQYHGVILSEGRPIPEALSVWALRRESKNLELFCEPSVAHHRMALDLWN